MPSSGDDFRSRLRSFLEARDLSARKAAALCGLEPSTISRYLKDDRAPDLASVMAMRKGLGLSVDWVLTGAGSPVAGADEDDRYRAGILEGLGRVARAVEEMQGQTLKPASSAAEPRSVQVLKAAAENPLPVPGSQPRPRGKRSKAQ